MIVLMSALLMLAAEPAAAATAAPTGVQAAAPGAQPLKPGERRIKVVCREATKANSRFAKKTCMEADAYARQQEIDREAFEQTQNQRVMNSGLGKGN